MPTLIHREIVNNPILPAGSYFYKKKNGSDIWKNKYTSNWYMVYPAGNGIQFVVEEYTGPCAC